MGQTTTQPTLADIKEARLKALANARELVRDAEILFANERFPRTIFLCQIAGEEMGKYFDLLSAAIDMVVDGDLDWPKFWKWFKSHHEKLKMITFFEDILLDQPCPDGYRDSVLTQVRNLEKGKQWALYADFIEGVPHHPAELFTREMAANCLKWAQGRLRLVTEFEQETSVAANLEQITREDILGFRERVKKALAAWSDKGS